jgi:hypothetical protein
MALILGLALEHWMLAIVGYFAIAALWVVATDPLWSGPISKFLWGLVKAVLGTAALLVAVAIVLGM